MPLWLCEAVGGMLAAALDVGDLPYTVVPATLGYGGEGGIEASSAGSGTRRYRARGRRRLRRSSRRRLRRRQPGTCERYFASRVVVFLLIS